MEFSLKSSLIRSVSLRAQEVIKMKILAAPDREDYNKGMQDLNDVKALLSKVGASMMYEDALEKFFPTYLEKETEWSKEVFVL